MQSSSEVRYLLAIYELSDGGAAVRSIDIAKRLKVSRASVVKRLKLMVDAGLIQKEYYGSVQLTPLGVRESNRVYTEYTLFYAFFTQCLKTGAETAREDAVSALCCLSPESKDRLIELLLAEKQNLRSLCELVH